MLSTLYEDEWLYPLKRFGKEIPGYYVSTDGRIYNNKSNEWVKQTVANSDNARGTSVRFNITLPSKDWLFEKTGYIYSSKATGWSVHRAVKESIEPIDEHPPECLADTWNDVPEAWRQWVRDTALIDHIDDDPTNNNVKNLRWATPMENDRHRKQANLKEMEQSNNAMS